MYRLPNWNQNYSFR